MSSDDWFSSFLKYTVNAIGLNDFFNSATVSDRDPSEATKEVKTTNDSIAKAKEVADAIKKALDEEKKEAADAKLEEIQAWLSINTLEPNRIPPPLHEIKNTDNVIERWNDIKRLNQTNYRYTYEMKAYDDKNRPIDRKSDKICYYKTKISKKIN